MGWFSIVYRLVVSKRDYLLANLLLGESLKILTLWILMLNVGCSLWSIDTREVSLADISQTQQREHFPIEVQWKGNFRPVGPHLTQRIVQDADKVAGILRDRGNKSLTVEMTLRKDKESFCDICAMILFIIPNKFITTIEVKWIVVDSTGKKDVIASTSTPWEGWDWFFLFPFGISKVIEDKNTYGWDPDASIVNNMTGRPVVNHVLVNLNRAIVREVATQKSK